MEDDLIYKNPCRKVIKPKSSYDKMWGRITKAINENLLSDAEKEKAEQKIDDLHMSRISRRSM